MKIFAKKVFIGNNPNLTTWDQPKIRSFDGKTIYGRPTKGFGVSKFTYAGKQYNPEPWTLSMKQIKNKAERWASQIMERPIEFTFCLCGLYETGEAWVPHHSDTVPTLDDVVLGISFGGTRVLEWDEYPITIKTDTNTSEVHKSLLEKEDQETTRFLLEEGDVYMFDGYSQMTSTHSIPPLRNFGCRSRISLTFRSGL